jgi:hypothetical protein
MVYATALRDDPAALVDKLGSPRYSERVDAASALVRLGRDALPALRTARNSRDAEVRNQALALTEAIESNLLVEPTRLELRHRDTQVPEVVRQWAERSGMVLQLIPPNLPQWDERRVTLESAEPVPFWTAIDRLCEQGGLQFQLTSPSGLSGRVMGLRLMPGSPDLAPSSIHGPFRSTLISIHHHRDLPLSRGGNLNVTRVDPRGGSPTAGQRVNEQFYLQMQILGEPRLTLALEGPPRIVEAVDDKGQSLLVDESGQTGHRYAGYAGYALPANSPMIQTQISLKYPAAPGKTIRRLRGAANVAVSSRRPEPQVVPLAEAVGKSLRASDLAVTIHDLQREPNGQLTIDLSLRSTAEVDPQAERPPGFGTLHSLEAFRNQIEIVDAEGNALPGHTASSQTGPDGMRVTLRFLPIGEAKTPSELRLYDSIRSRTEVTFDFSDIPMPIP